MGMFGRPRQTVFKPTVYAPGQRKRGVPRWLILLVAGIVLGSGGLLFIQHRYGPPRLTIQESGKLLDELKGIKQERLRLQAQLDEAQAQRAQSQSAQAKASSDLSQANDRVSMLTQTVQILQDAVPADPRGNSIGVRWAEFISRGNEVAFRSLISRAQSGKTAPFRGQVTVEVSGTQGNGKASTIQSDPVALTLDRYAPVQGSVPVPSGFVPRQATIRVSDAQQKSQAMRIYYVRGASDQ